MSIDKMQNKKTRKPSEPQKPTYEELEERLKIACDDCCVLIQKLRATELRCFDIQRLVNEDKYGMALSHFVRMHDFVKKAMRHPTERNV